MQENTPLPPQNGNSETPQQNPAASATKPSAQPAPAEPADTSAPRAPSATTSGSGKGLALTALILSLAALGASGYLFMQGQNTLNNAERVLNDKLNTAALGQSDNAKLLQQTLNEQKTLRAEIAEVNTLQSDTQKQLARAESAYGQLMDGRMQWLVSEIEHSLNVGAQQLMFDGNTRAAAAMLENIEKRLNRIERAEFLPIKQAISADLGKLKQQSAVDPVAVSLRLERLLGDVDNLPLSADAVLGEAAPKLAPIPENASLPWYSNLWAGVKENMGHLVEIRKIDNPDALLLSADQAFFVRQNIKLHLLDARLALVKQHGEVYRQDIAAAVEGVKRHFNLQAAATAAWLQEAADLQQIQVYTPSPDLLQNSLRAVRDYQDRNEETASADTGSEAAPPADEPAAPAADTALPPDGAAKAQTLPENNPTAAPHTPSNTGGQNRPAAPQQPAEQTDAAAKAETLPENTPAATDAAPAETPAAPLPENGSTAGKTAQGEAA